MLAESNVPAAGTSLLRISAVKDRVGLSRSTIYALIAEGRFPAPIHIAGTRISLWPDASVSRWIVEQMEAANA